MTRFLNSHKNVNAPCIGFVVQWRPKTSLTGERHEQTTRLLWAPWCDITLLPHERENNFTLPRMAADIILHTTRQPLNPRADVP